MAQSSAPFVAPTAQAPIAKPRVLDGVIIGAITFFALSFIIGAGIDKALALLFDTGFGGHFTTHYARWMKSLAWVISGGSAWPKAVPAYWTWARMQPEAHFAIIYFTSMTSALTAAGTAIWLGWKAAEPREPVTHIRGRRLSTNAKSAKAEAVAEAGKAAPGIEIIRGSGIRISQARERAHFIATGGTGSGKSVFVSHILTQAIERKDRVLLIDYKGLTEKTPKAPGTPDDQDDVIIVDPTDARSQAWAISHDVTTPWLAREAAIRMIPETKDPFWSSGSREILTAVMSMLVAEKPRSWGFRDLAEALLLPAEEIFQIAKRYYPQAARFVDPPDAKSTGDLLKNMNTVAGPVFQLSAAWENRQEISFTDWISNPATKNRTVILKISTLFKSASAALNQMVISTIVSRISLLPDVPAEKNRVWLIADEFPALGKIEGWAEMLAVGRSKGLRVVTVVQSVSQLKSTFGEHDTDTWTSIVGTQFFGRNDGETAAWYCKMAGEKEVFSSWQATSLSGSGTSVNTNWQRERLPVLLPSQCATELGEVVDVGCRSILYGLKDVHILLWPFLSEKDGWKKQREDFVPAAWTQEAPADPVVNTTEQVNVSESKIEAPAQAIQAPATGFEIPKTSIEKSNFEITETPETRASTEFEQVKEIPEIPEIFVTFENAETESTSDRQESAEEAVADEVAQHAAEEVLSEAVGVPAEAVELGFTLVDELTGSGGHGEIEAVKVMTPAQMRKARQQKRETEK